MKETLRTDWTSGTTRAQEDDGVDRWSAVNIDLAEVQFIPFNNTERRFPLWLKARAERDRLWKENAEKRLARSARTIALDAAKAEREALQDRGVYRGR